MKRKERFRIFNSLVYRCAPVSYYLEDLVRIIEAIERCGGRLKISDDEYEYASFDELKEKGGEKVRALSIEIRMQPSNDVLTLEFGRGKIILKSDRSERLIVLWHALKEVLAYRTRWYSQALSWRWTDWVFLALGWTTVDYAAPVADHFNFPNVVLLMIGLAFFLVAIASMVMSLWQPVVHLTGKREVANFFTRNIETVVAGVIGTVIGALVTAVVGKLWQ